MGENTLEWAAKVVLVRWVALLTKLQS
jgi:hypothetical protein